MAAGDCDPGAAPGCGAVRSLAQRYAEAEAEAAAAVKALNASRYGDPDHDAALHRYDAARAALGTREMLEEAERQRPGALAYGGAQADATSPDWYRSLLARSSAALSQLEPGELPG